jgi:hypothetical protein
MAAHIRSNYHIQGKDREIFEWACSDVGKAAFLRAHPSARAVAGSEPLRRRRPRRRAK